MKYFFEKSYTGDRSRTNRNATDSFLSTGRLALVFIILSGVIIVWSGLTVVSIEPISSSINTNRTTAGEIVKGVVLQQWVPVLLTPDANSVCYDLQFATYNRINSSNIKISLTQADYHQSVVLNSAGLIDNRSRSLCFSAEGLASGKALLEIDGMEGVPGKSPTIWMTSDMSSGVALQNGRSMIKGMVFRAYVRNYLYSISKLILAIFILLLLSTTSILIKNKKIRLSDGIEYILSILIVLCASYTAAPVIVGMTSTSMWNDELYSIIKFSSKGPVQTLTDYHVPNNHIFFNLLNSLLPFAHRYDPLSARFLSYIFVVGSVLFPIGFMIRRKLFVEACFLFFLVMGNKSLIDLSLQARGYGFLLLSASACCLFTWLYLETLDFRYAFYVAVTVWLATWTVPTFIIFGAPLMIILMILNRERIWLYVGMLSAVAILAVYVPVYSSLMNNYGTYSGQWGNQFADWNAVSDTVRTYLLFGIDKNLEWLSFLFVLVLVMSMIGHHFSTPHEKTTYSIALTTAICLFLAMKMKTPLPRTLAFVAFPLAFVFVSMIGSLFVKLFRCYGRMIMVFTLVAGVFIITAVINTDRSFTPIEAWMETAMAIENRFPLNIRVYAPFRNHFLALFISPERQFTDRFDLVSFIKGEMIVVDSSFIKEQAFQVESLPKNFSTISIPQRRGEAQFIYFVDHI